MVERTTFRPGPTVERATFTDLAEARRHLHTLRDVESVVVVMAVGDGVDFGNFYVYSNGQGLAHVKLHEHHEFLPEDPGSQATDSSFRGEDGEPFGVAARRTTTWARAMTALEQWMPRQAHWNGFSWR